MSTAQRVTRTYTRFEVPLCHTNLQLLVSLLGILSLVHEAHVALGTAPWCQGAWLNIFGDGDHISTTVILGQAYTVESSRRPCSILGGPLVLGLPVDFGRIADCVGILKRVAMGGRAARPLDLVLYLAGRRFPDCMWILGGFRIALGLLGL